MSGLNTSGMNGSGKYVSAVAQHALLVLLARLMAAFGVPIVLFLFAQIWEGQANIAKSVAANAIAIAVDSQRLDDHENRIVRIEKRQDRGH